MKTLISICLLFLAGNALALSPFEQRMLDRGKLHFATISWAHEVAWPDAEPYTRSFVAAQIEKESRWDTNARLCVPKPSCSRELGIGLGQFTITKRFNAFREVSMLHPLLRDWKPSDYTDTTKQILAIVVKDRSHYRQCYSLMDTLDDRMACVASSYNGGYGGFTADRRLCSNTLGCNPRKWFGNVEVTSLKAKVPLAGYGQSFYQINRAYSRGLTKEFRPKYEPYFLD